MVPLPKPPTDNLYKFLAVGGLLVGLAGLGGAFLVEHGRQTTSFEHWRADIAVRLAAALPDDPQAAARLAKVEAEAEKRLLADMAARRAFAEESMQFAVGTSMCGFLVSLVGFGLCYWLHQRHQDQLVILAVARAERETARNVGRQREAAVEREDRKADDPEAAR